MPDEPTQFDQENDLGRGGGEVDDETMREALAEAARRRSTWPNAMSSIVSGSRAPA